MNLDDVESYLVKQAKFKRMTDVRSCAGGSLETWVRNRFAELRMREASAIRNGKGVKT